MRANFRDMNTWCTDEFTSYIIKKILDNTTNNRTRYAPKQWLHDGFACWWAHDGFSADSEFHKTLILRSMFALKNQNLTPEVFKDWTIFRERFGEDIAEAVAYSGLAYLQKNKGRKTVIDLVKSIYGRDIPNDSRETIYELFHPMPVIFKEQTGEKWEDFISNWKDWINKTASLPEFETRLAEIPEVKGSVEIIKKEGNIRDIAYEFNFSRIPDPGCICSLLHKKLPPFDSVISPETLRREEIKYRKDSKYEKRHLAGKYNSGERVFLALEYDSDTLGIPVRILSSRINIE